MAVHPMLEDDLNAHYRSLFLSGTALLDLRAPGEFAQGAFPVAHNLPLMTDAERHEVGLCYHQHGQPAAIELGHALVSGPVREARMAAWQDWFRQHPDGHLYCFRGGLRSRTVQDWLAQAGIHVPRIEGGYKALRRFLLEGLEQIPATLPLRLLCGRSGAGKTRVIEAMEAAIDLEGRAHHRGSAFGRRPGGQPTQIDFEHTVAIDLLRRQARHQAGDARPVVLEDESKLVGHRLVPPALFSCMKAAPRVLIEEPLEDRVQLTLEDYVVAPLAEYVRFHGADHAADRLAADLLASLDRIRNRLGGSRHQELRGVLSTALEEQARSGRIDGHRDWIRSLLTDYYDPLYDHARQRQGERASPLFIGRRAEVLAFLRDAVIPTTTRHAPGIPALETQALRPDSAAPNSPAQHSTAPHAPGRQQR